MATAGIEQPPTLTNVGSLSREQLEGYVLCMRDVMRKERATSNTYFLLLSSYSNTIEDLKSQLANLQKVNKEDNAEETLKTPKSSNKSVAPQKNQEDCPSKDCPKDDKSRGTAVTEVTKWTCLICSTKNELASQECSSCSVFKRDILDRQEKCEIAPPTRNSETQNQPPSSRTIHTRISDNFSKMDDNNTAVGSDVTMTKDHNFCADPQNGNSLLVWKCLICNCGNKIQSSHCSVCKTSRWSEVKSIDRESNKEYWTCKHCYTFNYYDAKVCKKCNM